MIFVAIALIFAGLAGFILGVDPRYCWVAIIIGFAFNIAVNIARMRRK